MINRKIQLILVSVFIGTSIIGCNLGNTSELKNNPTVQTTTTPSITSTPTAMPTPTISVAPTKDIVIDNPQLPKPDKIELKVNKQTKTFNKNEDNYNQLYNAVERMIYKTIANEILFIDYADTIDKLEAYKENAIIYRYNQTTELNFKNLSKKRDGLLFPLARVGAVASIAYTLKKNDEYNGSIAFSEAEKTQEEALRLLAEEICGQKIPK